MDKLPQDWREVLQPILESEEYCNLLDRLEEEYAKYTIYPAREEIWTALEWTSFENTKVVIIGQDPYHQPSQAHGLSFSVLPGVKLPPSLRNIFKELVADLGVPQPSSGYLKAWAKQGVFLLNSCLTVRQDEANSHQKLGWTLVTDQIIRALNRSSHPIVFILWGRHAQSKKAIIDQGKHYIIESSHPSPLSARHSFFGSKPFSKANDYLRMTHQTPIDWKLL